MSQIVEKGAEEPDCPELNREPKPVVRAAHLANQFAIRGVEVEVRIPTIAGSQTNRWRADDPTDRGQLRGSADWFMPPLTGGCIVGAEVALVQAS